MYLTLKNLKIISKKHQKRSETQNKLQMMFFEVKMEQDRCCWCNYKLNGKKTAQITYLQARKQEKRYYLDYSEVSK